MALPADLVPAHHEGILLKGVGADALVGPIVALCVLIAVFLGVSLLKFRRTLD
jgi:hypothetical protein